MSRQTRQSPLGHLAGRRGEALPLEERAFLAHINLRGDGADVRFLDAVRSALGAAPPLRPNAVERAGTVALFWLGPDEWLVQAPHAEREARLDALRTALSGFHAAVTNVSDGHTVAVLDHPGACAILSRGCPLDLHESVFPVGTCAQSLFGKAPVMLAREARDRFAITVRRSFAHYLYHALQDAGSLEASR
jgi:sarcosine oxidase subunit gamma